MPKQALYLKWRPQTFEDVIGQEHVTRTLQNSIKSGRIRHAYLFSGPRGTGKTTTARLLAHALGARNLDLIEIDAASHTGVDDVRDLRDKIAFMPSEGDYKVYIIDEVHRFSGSAFDALLKTLEEPPPHAIFVLATTEIDKVPDTIKSRCLQFEFRRVSLNLVADRLAFIAEAEGLQVERGALELIARHGTGSVRDSISLFDQIVADPEEVISVALAQRILGTAGNDTVRDLVVAILERNLVNGMRCIDRAMNAGSDPRQFGQQVVEHLRGILLAKTASADLLEVTEEMQVLYDQQAALVSRREITQAIRAFNQAITEQRGGWQPQLSLELAFLESVQDAPDDSQPTSAAGVSQQEVEAVVERMLMRMGSSGANLPAASGQNTVDGEAATEDETVANPDAPAIVSVAEMRARWEETRAAVRAHSQQVAAYLEYASILNVSGNVVTIGVSRDIFMERLTDKKNAKLLQFVLSRLHGHQLSLRVVPADEQNEELPGDQEPADAIKSLGIELGAQIVPKTDED